MNLKAILEQRKSDLQKLQGQLQQVEETKLRMTNQAIAISGAIEQLEELIKADIVPDAPKAAEVKA